MNLQLQLHFPLPLLSLTLLSLTLLCLPLSTLQLLSMPLLWSRLSRILPFPTMLSQPPLLSQPLLQLKCLLSLFHQPLISLLLLPSLTLFFSQVGCSSCHPRPPRQPCQFCCPKLHCPRQPLQLMHPKEGSICESSEDKVVSTGCWGAFCCFKAGRRGRRGILGRRKQ